MNQQALLNLWDRALDSEIGIAVKINDRKRVIAMLYKARQEAGSPAMASLIIFSPNDTTELWICKKQQEGLSG